MSAFTVISIEKQSSKVPYKWLTPIRGVVRVIQSTLRLDQETLMACNLHRNLIVYLTAEFMAVR